MDRTEYTGDNLLETFEKLNINIGNLHPNNIKAWFDTDCAETKNFLNWMCSALSEKNYVSAQENLEYSQLENVLNDEELDKEIERIENEYPGLFEYESNLLDIELAQDEIELLKTQLNDCENQLEINERLNKNLALELSEITSEQIRSEVKAKEAQENCSKSSSQLDEANNKLYNQIAKYGQYLYNFEFDPIPQFLNSANVAEFEEKFDSIVHQINSVIKANNELSETATNKVFVNALSDIRDRLLKSRVGYLLQKMEVEKLNSVLNFLNSYDVNSVSFLMDWSSCIQARIESKNEQKSLLTKMIENSAEKLADHHVSRPKLRYAQNELETSQLKLKLVSEIEEGVVKILAHYAQMSILHSQEKSDIKNSDEFFRRVVSYINKDLQSCAVRKDAMSEVISEFEDFSSKPIEARLKLISDCGKLLTGNCLSLEGLLKEVDSIKGAISRLEKKSFVTEVEDCAKIAKDLEDNIRVLEDFLVCGATCKVVTVPRPLQIAFNEADLSVRNQNGAVKSGVQISAETLKKLAENKWLRNRRQLWMNFVSDPQRLLSILEPVE